MGKESGAVSGNGMCILTVTVLLKNCENRFISIEKGIQFNNKTYNATDILLPGLYFT